MKKNPISNLRKLVKSALVAAPVVAIPASAWAAAPTIADLAASSNITAPTGVTLQATSNTLNVSVTNGSTNTILSWGQFGVAAGDSVNFNLTSASSSVLNHVTGGSASEIYGSLISNGKVFILNTAGITIGATAQINTAGFVASTINDIGATTIFAATNDLAYTGATAGQLTVASGAIIKTLGNSGNVVLAGTDLNISGTVQGNLAVKNLTTGGITTSDTDGSTVYLQGLEVTGDLDVKSYGSNIYISGEASSVGGNASFSTVGNLRNGYLWQSGLFSVATEGKSITVDAAGSYGNTANLVEFNNVDASKISAKAGWLYVDALNSVTIADTNVDYLWVYSNAGSISSSGSVVVNEYVYGLSANAADQSVSMTFAGDVVFATTIYSPTITLVSSGSMSGLSVSGTSALSVTVGDDSTFGTLVSSGTASITATNGAALTLGAIDAATTLTVVADGDVTVNGLLAGATINLTSNTGSLLQGTGSLYARHTEGGATPSYVGTANLTAAKNIDFSKYGNTIDRLKIVQTDADSTVAVSSMFGGSLTLLKDTSVKGATTISSDNAIVFGLATGDTLNFGGNLSLTGTTITDTATKVNVTGDLAVSATSVTLDVLNSLGGAFKGSTVSAATVAVTTGNLNLGVLSVGTALSATAKANAAAITQSGKITVGTTTTLLAGGAGSNAGNITLTNAENVFNGAIAVGISGSDIKAKDVAITNSSTGTTTIAASKVTGSLTVVAAGNIAQSGAIVAPTATFTASNSATANTATITLENTANEFGSVTVNSAGASVKDATDVTIGGTQTALLTVSTEAGNIVLGSLTSSANIVANASATAGKTITDAGNGLAITGDVALYTKSGDITINGSGHNFGGITAITTWNEVDSTSNAASITLTEAGVLRLANIQTGALGSLVATGGVGVISKYNTDIINVAKTSSFNGGYVNISDLSSVNLTGAVSASGSDITINNDIATVLGNVTASGTTTVVAASGAISQSTGTSVKSFGDVSFTTTNAAITLGNSGNQFGKVTATSGSGNITVVEATTLNLKSITTTGDLVATSTGGDVIDTYVSATPTSLSVGGGAYFTSSTGKIEIDNPTSNFNFVQLISGTDATLIDNAGDVSILGGSDVTGNLVLTGVNSITEFGVVNVDGNATFKTTNTSGSISLTNPNTTIGGSVSFNTGTLTYIEKGAVTLGAGSIVRGAATVQSADSTVTFTGASTYKSSLKVVAADKISATSAFQVNGGLTLVTTSGGADLSILSTAANLNGIEVNADGVVGTYAGPTL